MENELLLILTSLAVADVSHTALVGRRPPSHAQYAFAFG